MLAFASVVVVGAAGCGGDDDASVAVTEPVASDEAAGDDVAAGNGDEAAAEPAPGQDNAASVTIDGTTYEIDVSMGPAPRCDFDFFGAILVSGGNEERFVNALLPPANDPNHTDPPNITLKVGDLEWVADPSKQMSGVEPGGSQVDDFVIDGISVSGSATFVELNETYAHSGGGPKATPTTGTFFMRCSD